jgi:hypothetical protein
MEAESGLTLLGLAGMLDPCGPSDPTRSSPAVETGIRMGNGCRPCFLLSGRPDRQRIVLLLAEYDLERTGVTGP